MRLGERYRTALVTGVSSGIGAAIAAMLRSEGVRVFGTTRDVSRVASGDGLVFLPLELGDAQSIDEAWNRAESESGGIDLLVNNAGCGLFARFEAVDLDEFERHEQILFRGPVRLAQHALCAMRARARGCIVNVTSLAVEFPIPYMAGYNSAKAALSAFTASLYLETFGVAVTVIDFRPGDYRTRFNQSMNPDPTNLAADPRAARVWTRLEENLAAAPVPSRAAADLRAALAKGRRGVVRSGSFFQAQLAPFLARFGSYRLNTWFQRRYFGVG